MIILKEKQNAWYFDENSLEKTKQGNYIGDLNLCGSEEIYFIKILMYTFYSYPTNVIEIFIYTQSKIIYSDFSIYYIPIVKIKGFLIKKKILHLFMKKYSGNCEDLVDKENLECMFYMTFALEILHIRYSHGNIKSEHILYLTKCMNFKEYYLSGLTFAKPDPSWKDKKRDLNQLAKLFINRLDIPINKKNYYLISFELLGINYSKYRELIISIYKLENRSSAVDFNKIQTLCH